MRRIIEVGRTPGVRSLLLVAFACAALGWVLSHVALVPYLVEDSYIHFRVAENLATTGHPYFNVGAAVKTSSSTVWTWLLALVFRVAPRNIALAAGVSACISLAGAVSWVGLLSAAAKRRLNAWEAALTMLTFLAVIQAASIATMETGLALLFASLGMTLYGKQKPSAFLWLAVASMTRLELCVLLLASFAMALVTGAIPWRRCACWAAVGLLPTSLFDLLQYGTLMPQAVVAKRILHQLPWVGAFSLLLPESVSSEFYFRSATYSGYATVCIVVATLPLLTLHWSRRVLQDPGVQLLVLSCLTGLTIAATYVLSKALVFPWYRPLYFSFIFLAGLIGAARSARTRPYLALLVALLPFLYELRGSLLASAGRPDAARHFLEGARSKHTQALAAELYRDYPNAVLMTSEIGAAGFGFRGRVEDGAGLASPRALSYYPLSVPMERYNAADAPVPRRFVEDLRPGIVIAVDRHLDAVFSAPLIADYVHIRRSLYDASDEARRASDTLLWDDVRSLDVLIRRDLWQEKHREQAR